MAPRTITIEDVWNIPRVGSPVPAPDGSRALVPVTTFNMDTNDGKTRLWLVPVDGGKPRPMTTAEESSGPPSWSPDGKSILFVRKGRKKTDKPQVHVMRVDGGEPERLTDLPLGALDPQWFPDGKKIAFLVPVYQAALSVKAAGKLRKKKAEDPVKAHVTEDRWYRHWDRWITDGVVHHIFVMDLETREMMDLIPGSKRFSDPMDPTGLYRISPDGREVAFSACRTKPPYDPILWGVFTAPVPARISRRSRAGKTVLISRSPGGANRPVYSPDGKWLLWGYKVEIDFYADRTRLCRYDRKTKKRETVTGDFDLSPMGWEFADDSQTIHFLAEAGGRTAIFSMAEGKAPKELHRGGWYSEPKLAGGRIFSSLMSLSEPAEAVVLEGKKVRTITDFARPHLEGIELGRVQEMYFNGADGASVQMFVIHPPDPKKKFKKGRRPLVHMIHGGPHGVFGDFWHPRWNAQSFAAPGYVVAMVNFHGSTSWGQEFAASILGSWGDQPYEDVMKATDTLVKKKLVDPRKMAVTGGSYGGYLVSWICSQTDRFACAVNHAGVCDFQTQYASDVTQGRRRSMGGEPWDDIDGLDRYNPMRHAKGFKTPMLVVHGMKDYRVPYAQGLAIYNVYKAMKLPARLVVYPDENHWILKPKNSVHWYGEVLGWLKRWL